MSATWRRWELTEGWHSEATCRTLKMRLLRYCRLIWRLCKPNPPNHPCTGQQVGGAAPRIHAVSVDVSDAAVRDRDGRLAAHYFGIATLIASTKHNNYTVRDSRAQTIH